MATHSSILAWRIHGQTSLVGSSLWDGRVRPDSATNTTTTTSVLWYFQFVLLAYSQIPVLSVICDSLLVGEECEE